MTTMTETGLATQVYQVFVKATPERIWDAITKPEFTSKYFYGSLVDSTFAEGAEFKSFSPDRTQLWVDGEVLESDPPRRLPATIRMTASVTGTRARTPHPGWGSTRRPPRRA